MPPQQVRLNLFYLEKSDAFLDIETDIAYGNRYQNGARIKTTSM